jgi:hypothetical protein
VILIYCITISKQNIYVSQFFFSALTVRYLTRRFIGDYETEHGMYIDQFPSFAYEKYFQSLSMSKLKKIIFNINKTQNTTIDNIYIF